MKIESVVETSISKNSVMELQEYVSTNSVESILHDAINVSWSKIAPWWPLQNLIAVNPIKGFEDLPFQHALSEGVCYFQQPHLPEPMLNINRETIKWCQAFLDEGQATIRMPSRQKGLYLAWRDLACWDNCLYRSDKTKRQWLLDLPEDPEQVIVLCLQKLELKPSEYELFLTLMLTTLPGWAAYLKYRTEWAAKSNTHYRYPVSQVDYLAMRLAITYVLWPQALTLLEWHQRARQAASKQPLSLDAIESYEANYRANLLPQLAKQLSPAANSCEATIPDAQLVFCIDVRSEPFRRAVEATGNYHTLGFAGFFGVPTSIEDNMTGEVYASCPVLLSPQHHIQNIPQCSSKVLANTKRQFRLLRKGKQLYQTVKYSFTTPFALVEALGPVFGAWMGLRTWMPALALRVKQALTEMLVRPLPIAPVLDDLTLDEQFNYAYSALSMMGLTQQFAPIIVLCGHGSSTQNNPQASALDCGACGGRHGASNARILAAMLNNPQVRIRLKEVGIALPETTHFIGAEHNTTTDKVEFYVNTTLDAQAAAILEQLQRDLAQARIVNNERRARELGYAGPKNLVSLHLLQRSQDWAQVRPEWGLARNASFIIGPRSLTKDVDLEGRAFLHSYDWQQDPEGTSLHVILTAPMVVAQWINSQYLFSTLDNVAYGGGSKITKNITGKIGLMQGNASDLMHGLALQSVYIHDCEAYHQTLRLHTIVYAPRQRVSVIFKKESALMQLVNNEWIYLICLDPTDNSIYMLTRHLEWQIMSI
ncbi:MAG: DUF2309 domain-containing protein [Gammaproteobacteria bacterium]